VKVKLPVVKPRVGRALQIVFGCYFLGAGFAHLALGEMWVAISNFGFFAATVVYWLMCRLVDQQYEIMQEQQKLNEKLQRTNSELLEMLQAELKTKTMEQLQRNRRATWS
jgi:uncharacterized membrane protein required for colicin V production